MLTHLNVPYPHEGACRECRAARRCNYCGERFTSSILRAEDRHAHCTNGRCLDCHRQQCTEGGITSPGHGFGKVGEPWRERANG